MTTSSPDERDKRILVTGGAGYIGAHAVKRLVAAGYQVTVVDNFYSGHRWAVDPKARLVEGSAGDRELIAKLVSEERIGSLMHFAAHIEVPESVADPLKYYRNNTVNSMNLFDAALAGGVKRTIFSSTAAVYGEPAAEQGSAERGTARSDPRDGLLREGSPIHPVSPYGHSKYMTEQLLRDLERAYPGFRSVILRYFNVAGAALDGSIGQATPRATHLIKVACECAIGKRASMQIFGTDYPTLDGTCVRDYIHVEDLIDAHLLALRHLERGGESDVFNCGYGQGYGVRRIIDEVKKVSGVDFKVLEGPRRAGDSPVVVADARKIQEKLGWAPQRDRLDLICKSAFDWERKLAERLK